jgi:dimethylargininase
MAAIIKRALVRPVSPRLSEALTMSSTVPNISFEKARRQHAEYCKVLETILGSSNVIRCDETPEYPDSCFVEDTMVVIRDRVVLNRLGHIARQGEVDSIKQYLPETIKEVVDMREQRDQHATCDGGDVLFTGRHLFVGLSKRTNRGGLQVLENVFSGFETVGIPVLGALHLKSVMTHIDDTTLIAWDDPIVDEMLQNHVQTSSRDYNVIKVPDALASNIVLVNQHVLAQDVVCQESRRALQEAAQDRDLAIHWVDTSELAKVDGALTCCSVLFTS